MSYNFYKVLHLVGIFMILIGTGAVIAAVVAGDSLKRIRKLGFITKGIGLLVAFVAGFGLLAKLGVGMSFPGWALVKIGIWMIIAAFSYFIIRKPAWSGIFWWSSLLLASVAGYLAIYKPF